MTASRLTGDLLRIESGLTPWRAELDTALATVPESLISSLLVELHLSEGGRPPDLILGIETRPGEGLPSVDLTLPGSLEAARPLLPRIIEGTGKVPVGMQMDPSWFEIDLPISRRSGFLIFARQFRQGGEKIHRSAELLTGVPLSRKATASLGVLARGLKEVRGHIRYVGGIHRDGHPGIYLHLIGRSIASLAGVARTAGWPIPETELASLGRRLTSTVNRQTRGDLALRLCLTMKPSGEQSGSWGVEIPRPARGRLPLEAILDIAGPEPGSLDPYALELIEPWLRKSRSRSPAGSISPKGLNHLKLGTGPGGKSVKAYLLFGVDRSRRKGS